MSWGKRGKRGRWRGEVGLFAAPKLLKPRSCVECKWEGERYRGREGGSER